MARLAGALEDAAVAMAARAGGHIDHLAKHRLSDAADLASAVALGTGHWRRAGLGARPLAGLALLQDRELDLLLGAVDRLLEGDPEVVAEV